jgi:hypothetical protein
LSLTNKKKPRQSLERERKKKDETREYSHQEKIFTLMPNANY